MVLSGLWATGPGLCFASSNHRRMFMNQEYLEFLLRFGPLIYITVFLIFLAIPVALLMIWSQLGQLNEHLRIQQAIQDAREETRRAQP